MIDINKIRSNYQKFASLKPKCDTVAQVQPKQQQQHTQVTTKTTATNSKQQLKIHTKRLPGIPAFEKCQKSTTTTSTAANNTKGGKSTHELKHSVRAANKHFFLSQEFKDQNFLREECELAHAQVAPILSKTTTTTTAAKRTDDPPAKQTQINNNNNATLRNNSSYHNNTNTTTPTAAVAAIASASSNNNNNNNKYNKLTLLSRSAPAATPLANGMRRTTTATTSTTTGANATTNNGSSSSSAHSANSANSQMGTTVHRLDLGFNQFKILPTKAPTPTAAATKSFLNSRQQLAAAQVRPLIHRTIPNTVIAAATETANAPNKPATAATKLNHNHYANQLHQQQHQHQHDHQHPHPHQHNHNNNKSSSSAPQSQHNNNNNNANSSGSSGNNTDYSTSNSNKNMQQSRPSDAHEHDDIKFIDCDDVATTVPATNQLHANTTVTVMSMTTTANSAAAAAAAESMQKPRSLLNDNTALNFGQKSRVRPKSTIICSSNNLVFEKINNYKYANGGSVGAAALETPPMAFGKLRTTTAPINVNRNSIKNATLGTAAATTTTTTTRTPTPTLTPPTTSGVQQTASAATSAAATSSRRADLRYAGIDSNSIKASIAKFNSLSEQKRLPPLAAASANVTMRAHAKTGSTFNLQQHRHSSDLDNCCMNRVLPDSSAAAAPIGGISAAAAAAAAAAGGGGGGGSLTRSPYRTNAAASKLMSSMQSIASNSISNSAKTATTASNAIAISPLANANANANANATGNCNSNSLPLKSSKHFGATRPAEFNVSSLTRDVRLPATITLAKQSAEQRNATTAATDVDDSSVRSTGRSVLPPSSPTSTRYWDRDSTRTSTLSSYGSTDTDVIKTTTDEKNEGLCGLRNIGNTCFMNSVIQCLSHTIELTRYLKSYNAMRSTGTKDEHILKEFAKLIQEMWSGNTGSVTPSDLKRAFSAKHRMYSDFNQQDAQEFLRFFLDSLHSALNSGVKGEPLRIDDNLSDNKKAELTWEWYTRIENSLIRDLFVGQLKSTLRCTACGNTSVTFDPFWDLSVPLPSSSRCKLDACLDLFIREEVLDGDEMPTCSKCKQRRKCTKSFSIQRFPKYLVIHLKRFSETRWSKLSNIVEFPTGERELNMAPYGANSNTNMYYSLYGVSNHMGSTAGGHYVALCKHPVSKKWHEFNDNIVSGSLSENHLVSSSAYILFYERA